MKFAKSFGRRKSSGNALDYEHPPENAQTSFRVLERPQPNAAISFDSAPPVTKRFSGGRLFSSPQQRPSGEDDGGSNRLNNNRDSRRLTWRLTWDRGSGGSGNTTNSTSTGYYDSSSAASARFSSHSTLPQADPDDEVFPPRRSKTYHPDVNSFKDLPPPPPRHKERTFSFGRIGKRASSPPRPKTGVDSTPTQFIDAPVTRERAQTTSSYATESSYASTAVPPSTLESGPSLDTTDFGADFGTNMFDGLGKRSSVALDKATRQTPPPSELPALPRSVRQSSISGSLPMLTRCLQEPEPSFPPKAISRSSHTPSPLRLDRGREVEPSPYSWGSQNSHEGLISSPPQTRASPSPERRVGVTRHARMESTDSAFDDASLTYPGVSRAKLNEYGSPRTTAPRNRDPRVYSGLLQDGDSQAVIDSVNANESITRQATIEVTSPQESLASSKYSERPGFSTASSVDSYRAPSNTFASSSHQPVRDTAATSLFDEESSDLTWTADSYDATPRATRLQPHPQGKDDLFDSSPLGPASMAVRPRATQISPSRAGQQSNKVMTPAQYEIYKRHQEASQLGEQTTNEDSDDSDAYDDEDEAEHNRQLAKQRQKQEAHLAVYRQKMMKVTGEQPSELPSSQSRPGADRTSTTGSNLTAGLESSINFDTSPGQSSKTSDEEDEDIPLGILAAHGFPSKNRPPTRLSQSTHSIPTQSAFPGAPTSAMAGSTAGGNLPPFAKNLPMDPYYGAGLVQQPMREALSFNNGGAGSVYGGSNSGPALPPGGLVGVIAGEERARAARRGSPNASTGFASSMPLPNNMPGRMPQGGMPGMQPGSGMGMGIGMPPMVDTAQMSQMQMNQQMTQYMAVQMQWMQQMMAMQQGQQGNAGAPQLPPMPQMPGMGQMPNMMNMTGQQPQMQTQNGLLTPPSIGANGRTMSMTTPPTNVSSVRHTIGTGAPSLATQMSMQNQASPRTMSMMNPPPSGYAGSVQGLGLSGNQQGGYAPSIAPSERSTIGQPSRYRPVTADAGNGSVASENTVQPLHATTGNARSSTMPDPERPPSVGALLDDYENRRVTVKAVEKRRGSPSRVSRLNNSSLAVDAEDEDDEAGWAEMKKMKERMKTGWKRKGKGKSEDPEQKQNEGLEGLYYGEV